MNLRHITGLSLSIFMLGALSGCISPKQTIVPTMKVVDIPPLHTEQDVELGDTMVSKGKIYTYPGIDLKNQVQAGDGVILIKFTIPPQRLAAKLEDEEWTYYVGDNVTAFDAMIGTKAVFGGLKISKKYIHQLQNPAQKETAMENEQQSHSIKPPKNFHPTEGHYAIFGNTTAVSLKPKPAPIFDFVEVNAMDKPSFTQELIYDGRAGDTVKFLYRELSHSMMRAPFTQEVQYDMKESNIVGFKGVRIEIIEATNTHLKYKVLNSFPDSN